MQNFRQVTDKERTEVKTYLSKSEKQLRYMTIEHLAEHRPQKRGWLDRIFHSKSRRVVIFEDRQWAQYKYKELLAEFRFRLCLEWKLCKKIDYPQLADSTNLVIAIADVIVPTGLQFPIPVLLIATTIVKVGARSFCACGEEVNS